MSRVNICTYQRIKPVVELTNASGIFKVCVFYLGATTSHGSGVCTKESLVAVVLLSDNV